MGAEHWIISPPKCFAVGMMVRHKGREWLVDEWPFQQDDRYAHISSTGRHGSSAVVRLVDVTAHCPMMPVKEAEEMAREAWIEREAWVYEDAGFAEWLAEWRERRAGDEG